WGAAQVAFSAAARVKLALRERLYRRMQALGPVYLQGERSGELSGLLVDGVEKLEAYYASYLPQMALVALVPLAILAFVFPLDWISGLVMVLTAPVIPLFMILIGKGAERLNRKQWRELARMSAHFLDVIQGLTTLKLFNASRREAQVIAAISDAHRRSTMGVLRVAFLSSLVLEFFATVSIAVVAVLIGFRLLWGDMSFLHGFFVLLLAPEFYLPLRQMGTHYHARMEAIAAAERIVEVLETAVPVAPAEPVAVPAPGPFAIRFENVTFDYPGGRTALAGTAFRVAPGERVALVGPSGSGKSTTVNLLLGFLRPSAGRVLINELDLSQMAHADWLRQVAWVPQRPRLFHGTVLDNIRLGRPEAEMTAVIEAARQAHAEEFIERLPQGYDTPIGEGGQGLSGGQIQRLALARAFLEDAPLVVLDEPTASLDPESEALVQAAIERLAAGRTLLVVAHRLATVRRADRIVVLEQGRVAESGSHAELIKAGGLYARLASAYKGRDEIKETRDEGWSALRARSFDSNAHERSEHDPSYLDSRPSSLPQSSPLLLLRLLRLLKPYWQWMALGILLSFATLLANVGLMAMSGWFIAAMAIAGLAGVSMNYFTPAATIRTFAILRTVGRYGERLVTHEATFRVLAQLRVWFYTRLEPLAPARLQQYRSGDLLSRIRSDIDTLDNLYLRILVPVAVALLGLVGVGLFLSLYHPLLALINLAFLLLAGVGVPALVQWLGRKPGRALVESNAALHATAVDGLQGMGELLVYGAAARQGGQLHGHSRALTDAQWRMSHLSGLSQAALGLSANLAVWLVMLAAIPMLGSGALERPELAMLALFALASFEVVMPLPLAFQMLGQTLSAAGRVFEIVDAEPQAPEPSAPSPQPEAFGLAIEGVGFRYTDSELPALEGIDLALPPGRRVAVVGATGSGKSTLLNLLLRFWDPQAGRITLGGHDLRDYHGEDLRRHIAVVSQGTHLFTTTLRENLRVANPQASEEQLLAALATAQLDEFVASQPDGLDTWVGEAGVKLSGGQARRVAIARALLKDAPILLLDEPTEGLDPATEQELMQALYRLMAGRTVLLITHRLVGLDAMDEILVLDRGHVAERGSHAELLGAGGIYAGMHARLGE
ncbi:MAG TPA: thiol reductant ABC exporter subunit CydD, partial [Gammaproteobacteria bacterium]